MACDKMHKMKSGKMMKSSEMKPKGKPAKNGKGKKAY